jgi:hypothetical protein
MGDNVMQYLRKSFMIIGENTKKSQDAYRENYERIFGKKGK